MYNNNDLYENAVNEIKSSDDNGVYKKGANIILGLGIFSLVVGIILASISSEPLFWFLLTIIPILLIICSFFARKGQTWAFIVPIVVYAIDTIPLILSLSWLQIVLRIGILVWLGTTLKNVLENKRIEKIEENMRQMSNNQ